MPQAVIDTSSEFRSPEEVFKPPEGFVFPQLDPSGIELETVDLGHGTFALMSNTVSVNNSGFIVGDDAVLVIDSHINGKMAQQILDAVKRHTSRPIRYLVNTNHHGDHSFGNYAFPAEVRIIAHRDAAKAMNDVEQEKLFLRGTVGPRHAEVFADIELRRPDLVYDDSLFLDLGGRTVEVHHFGFGNTPGDSVVYDPVARVAWTGNLTWGEGMIPLALHGRVADFIATIARFAATLGVETLIPGHGFQTTGRAIGRDLRYFADLMRSVRIARSSGHSLEQSFRDITLDEQYASATPDSFQAKLVASYHRFNIQRAYLDLVEAEA